MVQQARFEPPTFQSSLQNLDHYTKGATEITGLTDRIINTKIEMFTLLSARVLCIEKWLKMVEPLNLLEIENL